MGLSVETSSELSAPSFAASSKPFLVTFIDVSPRLYIISRSIEGKMWLLSSTS
jgi:hypothetical protein